MKARALLLDRDGVININHGYVHHQQNFDFIGGIFELVRRAYKRSYKIIVITNQAGIARGYYTEQQFHKLTEWMCEQFANQDAPISKVYFSPYHPTAGLGKYKKDDLSRKPNPGMILQAKEEFNLDLVNSILIGDKESDIKAGITAGVGCNILFSNEKPKELFREEYKQISSLNEAINFLTNGNS